MRLPAAVAALALLVPVTALACEDYKASMASSTALPAASPPPAATKAPPTAVVGKSVTPVSKPQVVCDQGVCKEAKTIAPKERKPAADNG